MPLLLDANSSNSNITPFATKKDPPPKINGHQ
jgi:hypothetical protein